MATDEEKNYYRFNIYFADIGAFKLHNVSEDNLAMWNEKLLAGAPFICEVGEKPYFFNPDYIIRTEAYVQRIGEYADDPRTKDIKP